MSQIIEPPVAPRHDHTVVFGKVDAENRGLDPMEPIKTLNDPYFWLRDDTRKSPEVLDYLQKENDYAQAMTDHLKPSIEGLFQEMKSHMKETDSSAPVRHGPWLYYSRMEEGKSHKIFCRRPAAGKDEGEEEEVLLDVNRVAEGQSHCGVTAVRPSDDHRLLAYAVDVNGNEVYDLRVVDLTDPSHPTVDTVVGVGDLAEWSGSTGLFFLRKDDALRDYQVWLHRIGTPASADRLLVEETNQLYDITMTKSLSNARLIVNVDSKETSEVHTFDAATGELTEVLRRSPAVLVQVDHWQGPGGQSQYFIRTNRDGAREFKLCVAAAADLGEPSRWLDLEAFPYTQDRTIETLVAFQDFVALFGRAGGLPRCWLLDLNATAAGLSVPAAFHEVQFPERTYDLRVGRHAEFASPAVRLKYSALNRPRTDYDYHVRERRLQPVKVTDVPNFEASHYSTTRLAVPATDGTLIPISVVWRPDRLRADFRPDDEEYRPSQPLPLYLYAYGSYGYPIDAYFRPNWLPFLDRGFVCVIAHIRGGGELGRVWYEAGKYTTKKNTFTDYCDVAAALVRRGWTSPDHLAIEGRSAGGLLMGAVLNLRPDLFRVALVGVPFVDVMTTMCDSSIPLTSQEWEEWGNPNEARFFDYMLSYSPINNIRPAAYPAVLATAGLNDPRVAYWEPAKWMAVLRRTSTGTRPHLLRTDLTSGHFSASDRYKYIRERAFELAFVFDQVLGSGANKD